MSNSLEKLMTNEWLSVSGNGAPELEDDLVNDDVSLIEVYSQGRQRRPSKKEIK